MWHVACDMAACATLAVDVAWPHSVFRLVHLAISDWSKWPSLIGPRGSVLLVHVAHVYWSMWCIFIGPHGPCFIGPRGPFLLVHVAHSSFVHVSILIIIIEAFD